MADESAHWYVIHTYSGYEKKVKESIEMTKKNRNLENQILKVEIPTLTVTELKANGVRKPVVRNMFPGYVLVNMIMNDDTWYVVRNTRGVTGFVGPGSKPVPLTEEEMKPLGIHIENMKIDFGVGDVVSVVAGAWKDTVGPIIKMDMNKQVATLNVEFFGQDTPLEISFDEISSLH
ncbi:MAG: transcription termination/antitermination factor NusG [Lachnospiraceae bacterium]|nr:transcription termination/antitermination factor NusG [Lachnospiraceae bacterium]